jgi:hypothetical protein
MYNCPEGEKHVKIPITLMAILAFGGLTTLAWADDLDDAYAQLKDAQEKRDTDGIKKWAMETSKAARAESSRAKPAEATDDAWKQRVDFAKQVDTLTEYALATAAIQPGLDTSKVVDLVDTLLAQNGKSQYLNVCTAAYLAALEKQGAGKSLDGAAKIVNGAPNNDDALFTLANGNLSKAPDKAITYANRLLNVMRTKTKPEGISEADFDKDKTTKLAYGYYIAGTISAAGARPSFPDCDKNLRAGLPYIGKTPGLLGTTYFYLGLCNYQIAKITNDRAKLQEAQKFSEQSAAMAGPMQANASRNAALMKQELGAPVVRR